MFNIFCLTCTGNATVMGSNRIEAGFFFRLILQFFSPLTPRVKPWVIRFQFYLVRNFGKFIKTLALLGVKGLNLLNWDDHTFIHIFFFFGSS